MNRIVILGNGFDLAHGLQSSYADFLNRYIQKALYACLVDVRYDSPLLKMNFESSPLLFVHRIIENENLEPIDRLLKLRKDGYGRIDTSTFFEESIQNLITKRWVDIENIYFKHLLAQKTLQGIYNIDGVQTLNKEIEFLRNELEQYLLNISEDFKLNFIHDYVELFCQPIAEKNDKSTYHGKPQNILIINFNYTSLANEYQKRCDEITQTRIVHVHGELGSRNNPIVFGYGDDHHKEFSNLKEDGSDELLAFLKPLLYLDAESYQDVYDFTQKGKFQTYVFGHSLGLSDRTLLKEIFENESCTRIKLFYYKKPDGSNDYREKTKCLSRHFSNLAKMNQKTLPFQQSQPMVGVKK